MLDKALEGDDYVAFVGGRMLLENTGLDSEINVLAATQFIFAKYIEVKYCSLPYRTYGVWWPLKAGQALLFNNYRPHGDSTLPVDSRNRCVSGLKF